MHVGPRFDNMLTQAISSLWEWRMRVFCFFLSVVLTSLWIYPVQGDSSMETQFNSIKDSIITSARTTSSYGAAEAIEELNANLVLFDSLYNKIKSSKHPDDVINEVAEGLTKLSVSYRKIAMIKNEIFKVHNREFDSFRDNEGKTLATIKEIQRDKASYVKKIANAEESLKKEQNEIEKQKLNVSLQGWKSIIKSLEAQELIWNKFYEAQEKLLTKLKLSSEKISLLFHIIDTNATVYKYAAEVARLRKSALEALVNLASLTDLQALLNDMTNNWLQVNEIVDEISTADFRSDKFEK
jgi:hypothetical protein